MTSSDKDGAAVRFPPPLIYLILMISAWLLPRYGTSLPIELGRVLRLGLAATLGVAAVVFMVAAVSLFRRTGQNPEPWKTTPEIISTGIYRFTRNPMYVGMALAQAALGVFSANGWFVVFVPVALALVYVIAVRPEEAYLEEKFGQAYTQYRDSVRRWL